MENAPWVAIQRNPMSGPGRRGPLHEFLKVLRKRGFRPRLFSQRARLDACLSVPERSGRLHAIVAAGGDGTVLDLLNRFPGVPIGILPLGTENLLARQFGIPFTGAEAAEVIAAGHTRPLDLGCVGSRRFAVMVSAGFDAAVIHAAHAVRTGPIRRWHYVPRIGQSLRTYGYPELKVYADGASVPVVGRLVVAANVPAYALGLRVVPTARGDDGLLDVRVFRGGSTFQMLRYLYMVATGSHDRLADVTCLRAKHLRIDAAVPVPVQADGDPAGTTPCEVALAPAAARLFVPG